jgi:NCS1 family nucleobase:cation symporter-1
MAGLMVCDFWVVRRRKFKLTDLYNPSPSSIYWYNYGFNWRSLVSWICGMAPALPGFANAVNPSISVSTAAQNLFALAYIEGFAISFVVHGVINWFWPPVGLGEIDEEDYYGTFTIEEAKALGVIPHASLLESLGLDISEDDSQGVTEITEKTKAVDV